MSREQQSGRRHSGNGAARRDLQARGGEKRGAGLDRAGQSEAWRTQSSGAKRRLSPVPSRPAPPEDTPSVAVREEEFRAQLGWDDCLAGLLGLGSVAHSIWLRFIGNKKHLTAFLKEGLCTCSSVSGLLSLTC